MYLENCIFQVMNTNAWEVFAKRCFPTHKSAIDEKTPSKQSGTCDGPTKESTTIHHAKAVVRVRPTLCSADPLLGLPATDLHMWMHVTEERLFPTCSHTTLGHVPPYSPI
jgi:hypothetical protein